MISSVCDNQASSEGFMTSPNFPQHYSTNQNCVTTITGNKNSSKQMHINFEILSLNFDSCLHMPCCQDNLSIQSGAGNARQFCNERSIPMGQTYTFELHDQVNITFVSDSTATSVFKGFLLYYKGENIISLYLDKLIKYHYI